MLGLTITNKQARCNRLKCPSVVLLVIYPLSGPLLLVASSVGHTALLEPVSVKALEFKSGDSVMTSTGLFEVTGLECHAQ